MRPVRQMFNASLMIFPTLLWVLPRVTPSAIFMPFSSPLPAFKPCFLEPVTEVDLISELAVSLDLSFVSLGLRDFKSFWSDILLKVMLREGFPLLEFKFADLANMP